ncbi:MAG: hypothetical protein N2234_05275 [Planctomycetota bacterium]|nr:hypothetical protein [Planctomycetota bacterium]
MRVLFRLTICMAVLALCVPFALAQEGKGPKLPGKEDIEWAARIVRIFHPELVERMHKAREEGREEEFRELVRKVMDTAKALEEKALAYAKERMKDLFEEMMGARKEKNWERYTKMLLEVLERMRNEMKEKPGEKGEKPFPPPGEKKGDKPPMPPEPFGPEADKGPKPPRPPEPPSEEEIEKALELLEKIDPEFVKRLKGTEDKELRRRMTMEAVFRARELMELKERDPHMFELMVAEMKLKRRIEEVVHQYHKTDNPDKRDALREELKELLEKLFDIKIQMQAHQIERLMKELEELKAMHKKHMENRDRIIEKRLKELLGENEGGFDW